jgi:hypothetical protein
LTSNWTPSPSWPNTRSFTADCSVLSRVVDAPLRNAQPSTDLSGREICLFHFRHAGAGASTAETSPDLRQRSGLTIRLPFCFVLAQSVKSGVAHYETIPDDSSHRLLRKHTCLCRSVLSRCRT